MDKEISDRRPRLNKKNCQNPTLESGRRYPSRRPVELARRGRSGQARRSTALSVARHGSPTADRGCPNHFPSSGPRRAGSFSTPGSAAAGPADWMRGEVRRQVPTLHPAQRWGFPAGRGSVDGCCAGADGWGPRTDNSLTPHMDLSFPGRFPAPFPFGGIVAAVIQSEIPPPTPHAPGAADVTSDSGPGRYLIRFEGTGRRS